MSKYSRYTVPIYRRFLYLFEDKDLELEECKTRDLVEKHFDTLKNEVQADVLYLGDRSAVCGHLLSGFSVCISIANFRQ